MKKLKLDELKVQSFITENDKDKMDTVKGGISFICGPVIISVIRNCTGNCGTAINVTCKDGCDLQSVPVDECI